MAFNGIGLSARVANGPSWGHVAEYPLIHPTRFRTHGWQFQCTTRQESTGSTDAERKQRVSPLLPKRLFNTAFLALSRRQSANSAYVFNRTPQRSYAQGPIFLSCSVAVESVRMSPA